MWKSPFYGVVFSLGWAVTWVVGINDWPPSRHWFAVVVPWMFLSVVFDISNYRDRKQKAADAQVALKNAEAQ